MFIPKIFPFLSMIEDDDTVGDSTDQGQQQEVQSEVEEPKDNPAWNDALSVIPEEFHPHLKEHFSKTDKYTQEVQQRFAPFKEFAETGVKPEEIKEALQFAHFLNTNPRGVFDFLNTQYNYIPNADNANQSQGAPAKQEDEIDVDNPLINADLSKNPQFQQIAQQNEALQAAFEADQQAKLEAKMDAQIQAEIQAIQKSYPSLDPREVITRALGKQAAGLTKDVDLAESAKELASMFQAVAPSAGSSAPPVLGRSSLPSSQVKPSEMSREERSKYVAEQIRALQEG